MIVNPTGRKDYEEATGFRISFEEAAPVPGAAVVLSDSDEAALKTATGELSAAWPPRAQLRARRRLSGR